MLHRHQILLDVPAIEVKTRISAARTACASNSGTLTKAYFSVFLVGGLFIEKV
jgi:hypothetical protein